MTRALLTEGERSAFEDEEMDESTRSSYKSRVRKRVNTQLATDIRILRENDDDLYETVRELVCEREYDERIAELEAKISELESRLDEQEQGETDVE